MPHTLTPDAAETLDELEKYYVDKLAAVQAKRAGHSKATGKQELVTAESVHIAIDPERKQVTLSWR